ncbi:unnamed protein product [Cladocopium goreaui]|uniref:Uncharacterized protein n=1 Tax=Cladocopium goreaui TaxID=2562237 RepID=A0A9P1BGZ8_9DINO|nr:unnamed protein product [Cladocopium goreaui]
MVEGVLCSSASRSAVVASGRPCGVLQGDPQVAPLLSVRLQDLLPKGQRQRRKYLLESEEESEETREQFAKAVAFWTSSRLTKQNQVAASALESEPPEYFISHVWQPPDQATSMHDYGEEKVNLLKHWAIRCKALMPDGDGRALKTPWFLLENDEEQQMAMTDPMNSWRTMRCWVDKACAHRGFGLAGAPPQEALRATKVALCNCDELVALISHPGYFHRLWCCIEWAFFLSRAAPKYRSLEILMPDALHQPGAWAELVHTAASFRVEDLRCTGDAFEHELRRELELLAVDLEGFEGFMRATSLALLTLHALLQQGEGCACFGSAAFVEAAVEACEACGLRGLGKVLATAQPMLWWRSAYRQVRRQYDERHHSGATEIGEIPGAGGNEGTLSDDPLEMLVRYVNKKWFREETTEVEPVDVATARLAPEEGEEEELLEDDAVVEPSEDRPADAATASMPLTLTSSLPLTLASLSETAELLLKQGITELPEAEAQEEEEAAAQCSPREAASYALRACEASKEKTLRAQKLEEGFMEDMAGVVQVPFGNTSPLVMDNAAKATFTVNFKRKVKVDTHIGVEDADADVADVADVAKTSSANAGVAETGLQQQVMHMDLVMWFSSDVKVQKKDGSVLANSSGSENFRNFGDEKQRFLSLRTIGPRDELRGEVVDCLEEDLAAWRRSFRGFAVAKTARSGAGLPDGYFDFWDAAGELSVQGEKLAPEAKVKARLFFQSPFGCASWDPTSWEIARGDHGSAVTAVARWAIYERRVCKWQLGLQFWFDAYVVPFLEVWRQRGIRTKGVIEEAFAESFLRVGGSIHDDLSQQLSQKESSGGETTDPRLMGYRHAESWENPCLERLLAIPRKEVTFVEGAGQAGVAGFFGERLTQQKGYERLDPRNMDPTPDRSMLPCIVSSSLPLQLGQTVAVACPALRDDDETKPMRFRGAKQEFYEQTMRIFSKNDMNNRHPGYAPDCSQLADVQVDHQLRKKIELSDRNFYRDPSRVQLQQEASYENRKVRMASLSPESSPKNRSRRGSRTSFGSDLRRNSSTGHIIVTQPVQDIS